MKCMILSALLALTAGCATTSAPQTFQQIYTAAVAGDDLIVQSATVALNDKLITAAQAKTILTVTDDIKTALDAAEAAYNVSNTAGANALIGKAVAAIAILSTCVTERPLTPATFDSCIQPLVLP
jgi:hypothetical protein